MTVRRVVAVLAAIALVGCSGSDGDPELVPESTVVTRLSDEELVEGAFEETDIGSETSDAPESSDIDGEPSTGETTATTTSTDALIDDGGVTAGGADVDPSPSTTNPTPTTVGSATAGETATSGDTTGSTDEIEALTGVITIGTDRYIFPIDACTTLNEETSVTAESTLNGVPFFVDIYSIVLEVDDGVDETVFEVNLEIDPDGDGDQPYFFATGVQPASGSDEFNIEFSVTPSRITASGPIVDDFGIATADGETLPMNLDIRCT